MDTQSAGQKRFVYLAGGTGYIGSRLIEALLTRGHRVRALVRSGSEHKLPPGCEPVIGYATRLDTFCATVAPCDTFVQMVGVSHPAPYKAKWFRAVDLAAARAGMDAAAAGGVRHFVYLSVAQPAPVMRAYVATRVEAEAHLVSLVAANAFSATVLRPWYVLGPGRRWPLLLQPLFRLLEWLPTTRAGARRLGLVSLEQMVNALVHAVEHPAASIGVIDVPAIRQLAAGAAG